MTADGSPQPRIAKTEGYVDTTWVSALRAAAAVTRRATSSEADLLRAVSEELRKLHLLGGLALITEDNQLEIRARLLSPSVERALLRLSGTDILGYRFDPAQSPAYYSVLESGEPLFVQNRQEVVKSLMPAGLGPLLPAILRLIGGNQPTILAPLITSDRPLGVINVSAAWLSPEYVPTLAALADHIAIAIDQVRAREQMGAALEGERLRNQAAETVTSALDLPVVLERVIQLAVEVSGADVGAFALLEPDGENLGYPYTYGLPDGVQFSPAHRGEGLAWHMLRHHQPLLLDEYGDHEEAMSDWTETGLHAFLGIPLFVGDEPIGAMGLFKTQRNERFHREQLDQTRSIANMAAIAIKNAQLYRQMERRAEEAQALIQTSASISASLDLETVLRLIAEQAKRLLKADGSRIHMLDPSTSTLRTLVAMDPQAEAMLDMELAPEEGLAGHVLQSGEALVINNPASDPRGRQVPGTPDEEPECLALAPLNIRQRTMGVMAVRRMGSERPFQAADLNVLTAFAAHAAVAIENADLYGQIEKQAQRLEKQVVERTRDLILSEARYRGLVETSLTGIVHIDNNGTISYANQVFADMIEHPVSQVNGMSVEEAAQRFLPESNRSIVLEQFRDRIAGARPASEVFEVEFVLESGKRIPTIFAVNRISDDAGNPDGITCLILDISERKELELALRSERDRLEAMLTNIGDAVMVTKPDGTIEYVNPAWERLNGYRWAEAVGREARILRAKETPKDMLHEMSEALAAGKPWSGDVINQRKDGETYDAAVTITPIFNEEGQVVNLVGVHHDISALKELDRLKSQFVSDVSHELRTPLTNIRLYIDLLAENLQSNRSPDYIETLSRESERLAHLIDDLLSLSRLESGATPFQPRPIDINQLLADLSGDRRALAVEQEIELQIETEQGLPEAPGDARLLTQVFTNLLTNAMNYTPEGGRIVLRTRKARWSDRAWVVAEVEDTGLGIEPEERPLIFKRFFRGRASQSTGAPGTGLGLAICKEIAELHGGRIEVESTPGEGTRISVWLPTNASSALATINPPA
ncbi:MAG: GAF domain-containing protein [Anaerolineales bacterium]